MTTIINTPPSTESSDSGMGIVLGVIVGIAIIILFLVYGLPALRNKPAPKSDTINVNVQLPTDTEANTQ